MDRLLDWLKRGGVPVTVVGPGGVGKTALVRAVAHATGAPRDWFVDLSLARTLDDVLSALAGDRVHVRAGIARQVESRLERDRPPLVVLDCADHVTAPVAEVLGTLAPPAPGIGWLVTSRTEIPVASTRVLRLSPLACPPARASTGGVAASPAVEMLVERTRLRLPGFAITAGNHERVAELVRRLDGVPLAIELVASKMHSLSVDEILVQLEDGSLRWRARDVPERHRSLRHTVEWSWQGLPVPLGRAAAALSVQRGAFDAATAEALLAGIAGDPRDALDELCASSILVADHGGDTGQVSYRFLDFIGSFAREELDRLPGTAQRARANHARHHLALARRLIRQHGGPGFGQGDSRALAHVAANCAAARAWFAATGAAIEAAWIALAQSHVHLRLGQFDRARAVLDCAAAPGSSLPDDLAARLRAAREMCCLFSGAPLGDAPPPPSAPASALFAAALEALLVGDLEAGQRHAAGALAATADTGDSLTAALTRVVSMVIEAASGCLDDCDRHFEAAVAPMRNQDVPEFEILAWMALGLVHLLACRIPAAQAALARAEKIGQRIGADHFSATVDLCRGWMAGSQGRVAAALEHLARVRDVARATGATRGLAWSHYFAATALLRDQRHLDALVELEQSRQVFDHQRAYYFLTLIECRRTIALAQLGRREAAVEAHRAAEALAARLTGVPLDLVVALDGLHIDIARARAAGRPTLARVRARCGTLRAAIEERGLGRYEPIVESLAHLAPHLAGPRDALVMRGDFSSVQVGNRTIDLERQPSARRMLQALAEAGRSLTVAELFAAGWPGDNIPVPAATRRVYSAIYALRKQGLRPFLRHTGDGYALIARGHVGAR